MDTTGDEEKKKEKREGETTWQTAKSNAN